MYRMVTLHMAKLKRLTDQLVHRYFSFLSRRPFVVLIGVGILSVTLSAIAIGAPFLGWTPMPVLDPRVGFETRATVWTGRVGAHMMLRSFGLPSAADRHDDAAFGDPVQRDKRDIGSSAQATPYRGVCNQLHQTLHKDHIPHMVQAVLKINRLSDLFTLEAMKEMCDFETALQPELDRFKGKTFHRHMWSLANYAVCMSPNTRLMNCSQLTQSDVDHLHQTLAECEHYRQDMLACTSETDKSRCEKVPSNCSSLPADIMYRMMAVETSFDRPNEPAFINTLFPIYTYIAYRDYGHLWHLTETPATSWYEDIYEKANLFFNGASVFGDGNKLLQLKGLHTQIKHEVFVTQLIGDVRFGVLASLVVTTCILIYSRSIFYTLVVVLSLVFSLGNAYFVYTWIFGISFFPFMNLLVFVLVVGIGADDTFVLIHLFRDAIQDELHNKDPAYAVKDDDESPRNESIGDIVKKDTVVTVSRQNSHAPSVSAIQAAFSHAALSMFVTSVTTAAAFYANVISNVVVIKCFGVFAGTTMLINYLLVVTWLPASLIIHHTYIEPYCSFSCCVRLLPTSATDYCNSGRQRFSDMIYSALTMVVVRLRFLWIALFGALFVASAIIAFYTPGFRLPSTNPFQVFKSSHPYEWYDDYALDLFPFTNYTTRQQMSADILWGFKPSDGGDTFTALGTIPLRYDESFQITSLQSLRALDGACHALTRAAFAEPSGSAKPKPARVCWTSAYLVWSTSPKVCADNATADCCTRDGADSGGRTLQRCFAVASRQLSAKTAGSSHSEAYFDKTNDSRHVMVGYRLGLRTKYRFSLIFKDLQAFHENIEDEVNVVLQRESVNASFLKNGWFVSSLERPTGWYDLLVNLQNGTPVSIAVSISVALLVVICTTRTVLLSCLSLVTITGIIISTMSCMVLLRWPINIVESSILILTVGLSFDFTLHYAVAYQLVDDGSSDVNKRIERCLRDIGGPVFLAAITTFLCGLSMTPSNTQAFYQIGVFMCAVTALSWLYSTFFFLSLLTTIGAKKTDDETSLDKTATGLARFVECVEDKRTAVSGIAYRYNGDGSETVNSLRQRVSFELEKELTSS